MESHATPSSEEWMLTRERMVVIALESKDLFTLRRIAAMPGGFGSDAMRRRVWPVLLNTERYFDSNAESHHSQVDPGSQEETEVDPPKDERLVQNQEEGRESSHSHDDRDRRSSKVESQRPDTTPMDPHLRPENRKSSSRLSAMTGTAEEKPHPDEYQVLLDTKRSFVSYPKDLPSQNKLDMQADLQDLIVNVLRLYPSLSYFQGYHDIISVLYLTFIPPKPFPRSTAATRLRTISRDLEKGVQNGETVQMDSMRIGGEDNAVRSLANGEREHEGRETADWRILRQCVAVISLCRVRDGMGKSLEGVMGLLRILKRVLRAADPELDRFSSSISPVPTLPFFALSWILCLFSHDVDTLEPIQRMFDYLLSRNPISAIYLAVAILIAKKPQMFTLAKKLGPEYQDDPSLLHPLFSRLPPLYPDTPDRPHPTPQPDPSNTTNLTANETLQNVMNDDPNPYQPIPLSELFELTDQLMLKYPWDGDVIKGRDIMGEASVVCSYELEIRFLLATRVSEFESEKLVGEENGGEVPTWSLDEALKLVDGEIIRPGAATVVEDDDGDANDNVKEPLGTPKSIRKRFPIRIPLHKLGISTGLAIAILFVGVGMAFYGVRAGGIHASWKSWWKVVVGSWVARVDWKSNDLFRLGITRLGSLGKVLGFLKRSLLDIID